MLFSHRPTFNEKYAPRGSNIVGRSDLFRDRQISRVVVAAAALDKLILTRGQRSIQQIVASHQTKSQTEGKEPPIRLQNPYILPDTVWHPVARGQLPKSSS
ncbi:hypothetical protein V495_03159 [Pseudogymnoascus sp. VKM F-4514 (FW-929)]|nr:hypothetical protein V490_08109 [Pseudogymnoascus sp. VKM F-3557]KFY45017.1 hypothetical protein V495_03159 [Pseudogymnoascus sp. VKM F-4514 (FW-929)]KFY59000.1 hypothetical protein V497_04544 [Pseudogymnoascus sp. VKM F-4516 (FW-969)]